MLKPIWEHERARAPIPIHPSDVDGYLYFKQSETMTEKELIARLRKRRAPTEKMAMGTAVHYALEHHLEDFVAGREVPGDADGKRWRVVTRNEDVSGEILKPTVREIRGCREINAGGEAIELRGTIDSISGGIGVDYKVSFGQPDPEVFKHRFQWQAYMYLYRFLRRFRYQVLQAMPPTQKEPDLIRVKETWHVDLMRGVDVEPAVRAILEEYITFLRWHKAWDKRVWRP